MNSHSRRYERRPLARSLKLAAAIAAACVPVATGAAGCLTRPVDPQKPCTTSSITERLTQSSVDAIDILLTIDNSRSMADKQEILALAVSAVRGKDRVLLAGIVGVPWQDIARDKDDLSKGLKTSDQLLAKMSNGMSTWDLILGDPATGVPPNDPAMVEAISSKGDDLEYACTFELPTPRDCGSPGAISCDCTDPENTDVLCAENPDSPGNNTLQVRAG